MARCETIGPGRSAGCQMDTRAESWNHPGLHRMVATPTGSDATR